jgi:peptidoglycan/LPS O-acetylase OafA/YrhL
MTKETPLKTKLTNGLAGSPSVHLDALRGFAAFSVFLSHWRDAFFVDYPGIKTHNAFTAGAYIFTELGHQWVIVFFVMSGYLVGGSVLRSAGSDRWNWTTYMLNRLTRLYVVLLPALLLCGLLDWGGMHMSDAQALYRGHSGMYSLVPNIYVTSKLPVFFANLFFLQGTLVPGFGSGTVPNYGSDVPLWSLSCEFFYYLAFPLLVLIFAKTRYSWTIRFVFALGLVAVARIVDTETALLGIPWLMGSVIGYLPAFPGRRPWQRGLAIFTTLAALGGVLVLGRFSSHTGLTDMLLGVVVTLLIWVVLQCANAPLPSFYVKLARRAAHSSYTLYLVHLPMLVFLKAWLHLPRAIPGWRSGLIAAGMMAIVLLYTQLVYEAFEKNTDAVRKWIKAHVMGGRILKHGPPAIAARE